MSTPEWTKHRNGASRWRDPSAGAFALVEWIPIISIRGALGALLLFDSTRWVVCSTSTKIRHDLKSIVAAAEVQHAETGRYPQVVEDVKGDGFMTQERTLDPWGSEYLYDLDKNGNPRARCLGKDSAEGGEGDNRDYEYPGPEGSRPPPMVDSTSREVRR